ncbi:hypothetical protein PMZ80_001285 [Knufia obscura]|uniref:Uncharacterized protein n=1 Tax=Knufia obscura TaxID=1635080 RepID=A0ABR0S3R3_9EURO|nr:hypothetical protein PMZ80_001285 [Knufia obscura]
MTKMDYLSTGTTRKPVLKINTTMTASPSPQACGCKVTFIVYSCSHEFIRISLCDEDELEPVSPTTAEPDHYPVEVRITSEQPCDECAIRTLFRTTTHTTTVAALRLSESLRYDELLADTPETPQLIYMGSLSEYEQFDFDTPALSPDRRFTIDWDTLDPPARIPRHELSDTYTLPKLKYDPGAQGCAAKDDFEGYVDRKGLLPKDRESKRKTLVTDWRPTLRELESEDDLTERPRTGSPEYREAARILSKHDSDLMEWVSAGNAFDLKRVQTIRQRLRSSSIFSEVSLDLPIQLPSPLPVGEDSPLTATSQSTAGTDFSRSTGRSDSIRCIRPSSDQPPPLPVRSTVRKLRYFNGGKPSLIRISPPAPVQHSPLTPLPIRWSTWPRSPTISAVIQGPPLYMFKRQPNRKQDLANRVKKTVGTGLNQLYDALTTRRGIDSRARPGSRLSRRPSTTALSPKSKLPRTSRAAAKARAVRRKILRQIPEPDFITVLPYPSQSSTESQGYEAGRVIYVHRPL